MKSLGLKSDARMQKSTQMNLSLCISASCHSKCLHQKRSSFIVFNRRTTIPLIDISTETKCLKHYGQTAKMGGGNEHEQDRRKKSDCFWGETKPVAGGFMTSVSTEGSVGAGRGQIGSTEVTQPVLNLSSSSCFKCPPCRHRHPQRNKERHAHAHTRAHTLT